ncbi:hypothetical protein GCM10010350_78590 [Streptomyces galilaeus]|nr:hypothetical protein GCM10010350_78590 [Streptomyces galilaeus]
MRPGGPVWGDSPQLIPVLERSRAKRTSGGAWPGVYAGGNGYDEGGRPYRPEVVGPRARMPEPGKPAGQPPAPRQQRRPTH